jgi:WD40 repeat protein
VIFDERYRAIITVSGVPSRWSEDQALLANFLEKHTHTNPVIGCFFAAVFEQFVTIDSLGSCCVWNVMDGKRVSFTEREWSRDMSQICCAALDCQGRRLVTANNVHRVVLWNFNIGEELTQIELVSNPVLISVLVYVIVSNREFVAIGGWDRKVSIYSELEKGEFRVFRQYQDHTGDITAITAYGDYLISGTGTGELMVWTLDTNFHQYQAMTPGGVSIECITCLHGLAAVGDSDGFIHVFGIPRLALMASVAAHGINRAHSISAIVSNKDVLFTGDTLGYVKKWRIKCETNFELYEDRIFRAHTEQIQGFSFAGEGELLATFAGDMNVRLWFVQTCEYIGTFHEENSWMCNNEETWGKTSPAEIDPRHFSDDPNPPQEHEPIRLSVSQPRSRSVTAPGPLPQEEEAPPQEEAPETFDMTKIRQVFNEFFENPIVGPGPTGVAEPPRPRVTRIETRISPQSRSHLMPLTARPPELISRVRGLLRGLDARGARSQSSSKTDHVRLPIRTPKQKKQRLGVAQTL